MDQDAQLLPRDKLLRDTFTPAETSLYCLILITANVAFWLADPRSYWLLGFFLIAASMTPIILKTHEHTHPFFVTFLWPKFWLCTAPVWLFLLQFALGLQQQPFGKIIFDGTEFIRFEVPPQAWLPVSTAAKTTWPAALGFSAIYIVSVGLFLIPKSRAFFERLMPYLCLSAVLPALFAYIQHGMNAEEPLLTKGTGAGDFIGFFPYDGHWAAFAILWTCACISMALLSTRYDDSPPFVESTGPWYLTAGTIFGASAFLVEAKWPAVFLMLTYAIMMMLFAANIFTAKRDPHRRSIASFGGLISTSMFGAALYRILQTGDSALATESLRQAAREMFADRPLFGWGMDSFGHLLPFYGSDLLLGENYQRAGSDFLQILAENGILGFLPATLLLLILVGRYLKGRHNMQLSNQLLTGLASVLLLAFFDSPFMSPAVFFSFVILLFVALRWADISRNRADEVDAPRPSLVTPQSLRRVPFYTEPENEQSK
ncbi:MAG TPA: O-antigen ligase family protein [Opitutales bacterium]|nr:O-antigen ligase family protein [Opitutales bacterium]